MDLDKLKRLALNTHDSREYAIMVQNFFEMNRNVDPFYIAKTLGITVVPMPLSKNLFSFATIKDNQKYIFVNGYSPISRQRYNVALQMYLLLRGKSNVAYYKDHDKTTVISNAKTFAANLLLPPEALKEEVEKYKDKNGYISYYDIFKIADKFGVSFKTTAFRIFYVFNNIKGINNKADLVKKIGQHVTYREKRKKLVPEHKINDLKYIKELINSMGYLETSNNDIGYIKTIQDAIYGEIKVEEKEDLESQDIINMLAEYRLTGRISTKGKRYLGRVLTQLVTGQLRVYDFIKSKEIVPAEKLSKIIHTYLFEGVEDTYNYGELRTDPISIKGNAFRPTKQTKLPTKMKEINADIQRTYDVIELANKGQMSKADALDVAIETVMKHYMTQPYINGNGRTSKAMLNYFLSLLNIPGSFIVADEIIDDYRNAIKEVGKNQSIRESQLAGDYLIRAIKGDKIGKKYVNAFGIEMIQFDDEEEVYDEDIHKLEYYMPVEGKENEYVWEELREIDYTPIEIVIYNSILSTYLESRTKPQVKNTTHQYKVDTSTFKKSKDTVFNRLFKKSKDK